jgi:Tol biopolymer transport system component
MKRAAALSAGLAVVVSGFVAACGGNGNEPTIGNGSDPEIVFVRFLPSPRPNSFANTRPNIYVMNADGSSQRSLTSNQEVDAYPAWSPHDQSIAFASERDGSIGLFVMNADGSGQRRLTHDPDGDAMAAWSPDGGRIAFTRFHSHIHPDIYVMNADGSDQRRLTRDPANDVLPDWSPDGHRIAFVSQRDGNEEVYVMNADGSGQHRLTRNPADDADPDWSPDGRTIAFYSDRDGDFDIYLMNPDGSRVRKLTRNVASDSDPDYFASDVDPDWSPDGAKIVFASSREGNSEIYVMNADGSDERRLTRDPAEDAFPAWASRRK